MIKTNISTPSNIAKFEPQIYNNVMFLSVLLRDLFEGMKQPDLCNLNMKLNLRGTHIVSKLFCKQKNIFFLIMS